MRKKIYTLFNEKGQGLVEYTLVLAFCAALLISLNSAEFNRTIKTIYDKVVAKEVTNVYGLGDLYVIALNEWGHSKRTELSEIPDVHRLNADQQALVNIGKAFIGQSLSPTDVKNLIGGSGYDENYLRNPNNEVLIFNYLDEFNKDIYTGYKGDTRTLQVIHWMQGDYGTKNEDGSYTYSTDGFDTTHGTRYFYSDFLAIENKSNIQWGNDRSIRVSFTFKTENGKEVVDSVRVRVNRGSSKAAGTHFHELDVKVTNDYQGQYTPGATGKY